MALNIIRIKTLMIKKQKTKFKEAAEAYEVLSNPDKKARYDQFGHQAFENGGGFGGQRYEYG